MKKPLFYFLSAVNLLLIVLCLAGCVYIISAGCGVYFTIAAASEFFALVFSVLYYYRGYRKDAAKYYRLFMLFYAFTYLAEIAASVISYETIGVSSPVSTTIVFSMILYGNTLILAVGKDLGKTASYCLCGVNVFFYLLPVIGCLLPGVITFADNTLKASSIILYCTWLVLALNALIMTVAKYKDKASRGRE